MTLLKIRILIIIGFVLAIITNPVDITAEDIEATLKCDNNFLICNKLNDFAVNLIIDIGDVVRSDSLYACNFEIEYNPEIIRVGGILTYSTIAEKCDDQYKGAMGDSINRTIRGYFYSEVPLIGKSKPLFGLRVELRDTCYKGSIPFKIKYLEFTDEFKKHIVKYNDTEAIFVQNDLHKINLQVLNDSLFFEKNNKVTSYIKVVESNYKNNVYGFIKIKNIDSTKFNIDEITFDKKYFDYINVIRKDNDILLEFKKNRIIDSTLILSVMSRLDSNLNIKDNLQFGISLDDVCNCNILMTGDSTNLISKKSTSYIDNEEYSFDIQETEEEIKIFSQDNIRKVELYDILGTKQFEIYIDNSTYKFEKSILYRNSVYFLIVYTDLNIIRKKIILNN